MTRTIATLSQMLSYSGQLSILQPQAAKLNPYLTDTQVPGDTDLDDDCAWNSLTNLAVSRFEDEIREYLDGIRNTLETCGTGPKDMVFVSGIRQIPRGKSLNSLLLAEQARRTA